LYGRRQPSVNTPRFFFMGTGEEGLNDTKVLGGAWWGVLILCLTKGDKTNRFAYSQACRVKCVEEEGFQCHR
jgi:hypothetical protein